MLVPYTNDDLTNCVDLFIRTFNNAPWYNNWNDASASDYLKELVDNKRFVGFLLKDKNVLIGAIFSHLKTYYSGNELYIDELYISPEYQHRGYGKIIMSGIEEYAQNNSLISITLLTGKEKAAFNFFVKCGCKHLDSLAFMYKRIQ